VEDILRKDVVAAIFDKQPLISLGPQNDQLPDYTAHQNEALRESVHAQVCAYLALGPSICTFYKASAKSYLKSASTTKHCGKSTCSGAFSSALDCG
jgi:hypothetical protein